MQKIKWITVCVVCFAAGNVNENHGFNNQPSSPEGDDRIQKMLCALDSQFVRLLQIRSAPRTTSWFCCKCVNDRLGPRGLYGGPNTGWIRASPAIDRDAPNR